MLTKEEFQREYIRMMDSLRDSNSIYRGELSCIGVSCSDCPLYFNDRCNGNGSMAFKVIEIVEKWSKEHPIQTNLDKFKEVFGGVPKDENGHWICPYRATQQDYMRRDRDFSSCKTEFWNSEYKPPVKENEGGSIK